PLDFIQLLPLKTLRVNSASSRWELRRQRDGAGTDFTSPTGERPRILVGFVLPCQAQDRSADSTMRDDQRSAAEKFRRLRLCCSHSSCNYTALTRGGTMGASLAHIREEFPALRDKAFFDSAGVGIAPRTAVTAIGEFLDRTMFAPVRSMVDHHLAID